MGLSSDLSDACQKEKRELRKCEMETATAGFANWIFPLLNRLLTANEINANGK